jgi:hypothetical protein
MSGGLRRVGSGYLHELVARAEIAQVQVHEGDKPPPVALLADADELARQGR